MPRGKEVDVGILVYAREAKLEILNRSMTHEIAFEMAASNVRFGAGDSFVSATARAFAKFAALVNRRRSPSNGFTSASSLTNCAAAALGPPFSPSHPQSEIPLKTS